MADLRSTYEDFDRLRDAVKDYWTEEDLSPEELFYAQGVTDMLGFLMVNTPSGITQELVDHMKASNIQLAEVFEGALRYL